jgi:hypothetical protein
MDSKVDISTSEDAKKAPLLYRAKISNRRLLAGKACGPSTATNAMCLAVTLTLLGSIMKNVCYGSVVNSSSVRYSSGRLELEVWKRDRVFRSQCNWLDRVYLADLGRQACRPVLSLRPTHICTYGHARGAEALTGAFDGEQKGNGREKKNG